MSIKTEYHDDCCATFASFNLPITVEVCCPNCSALIKKDLREEKITDLIINKPFNLKFEHECPDHSLNIWTEKVIFKMGMFEFKPAVYRGWKEPSLKIKVIKAIKSIRKCSLYDAKDWAEKYPHSINQEMATALEKAGAVIEWRIS